MKKYKIDVLLKYNCYSLHINLLLGMSHSNLHSTHLVCQMALEVHSSHTAHQLVFPPHQQDLLNHMDKDHTSRINIKGSIKVLQAAIHLKVVMALQVKAMALLIHPSSHRVTHLIQTMGPQSQHLQAITLHQLIQVQGTLHLLLNSLMLLLRVVLLQLGPHTPFGHHLSPPTQETLPILLHNLAPTILMLVSALTIPPRPSRNLTNPSLSQIQLQHTAQLLHHSQTALLNPLPVVIPLKTHKAPVMGPHQLSLPLTIQVLTGITLHRRPPHRAHLRQAALRGSSIHRKVSLRPIRRRLSLRTPTHHPSRVVQRLRRRQHHLHSRIPRTHRIILQRGARTRRTRTSRATRRRSTRRHRIRTRAHPRLARLHRAPRNLTLGMDSNPLANSK